MTATANLPPSGVDYDDEETIASLSNRVGREPLDMRHVTEGAIEPPEPRANRYVLRLCFLANRRYRKEFCGDLLEDLNELRSSGVPEDQLVRYVIWQYASIPVSWHSRALYRIMRWFNPFGSWRRR